LKTLDIKIVNIISMVHYYFFETLFTYTLVLCTFNLSVVLKFQNSCRQSICNFLLTNISCSIDNLSTQQISYFHI